MNSPSYYGFSVKRSTEKAETIKLKRDRGSLWSRLVIWNGMGPGMSPEPIFGPKFCFFLRYTHITTFIWAQADMLFVKFYTQAYFLTLRNLPHRNISPTYPEVTLDTFGFPVGGRLAARWPVFRPQ